MSASDWEEIRLLAADFHRAQLSSTVQRLSERNCVEIVNKLLELKLVEIIYTQDGKEYLTPEHLASDVKGELFVRGGRISLSELQQITNVDYSHIESCVKDIISKDKHIQCVLGDLISRDYLNKLARDINDQLQEQGHVTISELAKSYDLPGELLSQVVQRNLGSVIKAHRDDTNTDYLYTESAVARHRARIRGTFSAITKPTPLANIRHKMDVPGDLFYVLLEKLISGGRLRGAVYGGRRDKATYNPDIYSRTQNEWVDSFYRSNGYLEYDALTRLGIADPQGFIRRRYSNESLSMLATCCVGSRLCVQLEAGVEEAMCQGSWIDVMPLLPSIFSEADAASLLSDCLKQHPTATLLCGTVVVSSEWLAQCHQSFDQLVTTKAEADAMSNPALFHPDYQKKTSKTTEEGGSYKDQKREQRRKKATAGSGSTKSGGGTQGREIKTRSTKKKSRHQVVDSSDDESGSRSQKADAEFMSTGDLETVLRERGEMDEAPDEMFTEVADLLYRPLCSLYQERATAIFLQSTGAATGSDRRKTHEELQEKISGLWMNVKLFERGMKPFLGKDDVEPHLVKHLLKTVCTTITNHVVIAMATDHMMSVPSDTDLSIDARQKLIAGMPEPSQSILLKLNGSLNGKDLEQFFGCLDNACGPKYLGVLLRKPDKKKERPVIQNHKHSLIAQLEEELDPAMTLHLSVTLLYLHHTHSMLHAPGRCVPAIVSHLSTFMAADTHRSLVDLQDLVILHLKASDKSNDKLRLANEMAELVPKVKEIAMTPGKATPKQEPV